MKEIITTREGNMAVITLENGRKMEAPATPEGYAFLEDLLAISLTFTLMNKGQAVFPLQERP